MSLSRLVYYSAVIGGWSALLAWSIAEFAFLRNPTSGNLEVAITGALVGGAIGAGLNAVAGMANGQFMQLLQRMVPGLVGGGIGGAAGGLLGNFLFLSLGDWSRALGWLVMGLGIGIVEGLYERSPSKIRNGLIGGATGGLIGGFLFDPMQSIIRSGSGMSSRATAFVILGMCIGALIGLVQVAMKEAWLTVLDGYRAGRQLILSRPVTFLGRGDHVPLPFLGLANKDLDAEHVRITRQPSGSYVVEDNHTRLGTRLNAGSAIQIPVPLKDGDVIKFGTNFVRFNERQRKGGTAPAVQPSFNVPLAPPPPPVPATRSTTGVVQSTVGSATGQRTAESLGTPNRPALAPPAAPPRSAEPPRMPPTSVTPQAAPAASPVRPPAVPFHVPPPPPPPLTKPAIPAAGPPSTARPVGPPSITPVPGQTAARPIVPPPPPPAPPRRS